jgi:hypothetical protein
MHFSGWTGRQNQARKFRAVAGATKNDNWRRETGAFLSLIVTNGSPASFNVSVFDMLPLYFQWQKNGMNLTGDDNISGSTTTNLVLTNVNTNDAGNYTVIITCLYGSVTSSVATLAVVLPLEPPYQTVMAGGMMTFSVAVLRVTVGRFSIVTKRAAGMANLISSRTGRLAERRTDDLEQIVVVNRLVEKRHRTAAGSPFLVFWVFADGNDDDRNSFGRVQPLQPFHDTKTVPRHAVHVGRKNEVQQNQIGIFPPCGGDGLCAIQGRDDLIADRLKFQGNCLEGDLAVIHHQNFFLAPGCGFSTQTYLAFT